VTPGKNNAHHAPLVLSALVDCNFPAKLVFTALVDKRNVNSALKDLSALKEHRSQLNAYLDLMSKQALQLVSNVKLAAFALMAKCRDAAQAHSVMQGSNNAHPAPLVLSVLVGLNLPAQLVFTALVDKRNVNSVLKDHSALKERQNQSSVHLEVIVE